MHRHIEAARQGRNHEVTRRVLSYLDSCYKDRCVPSETPGVISVFGDLYALALQHPFDAPLSTSDVEADEPPRNLRVYGLPKHLWSALTRNERATQISLAQEQQLHIARLKALKDIRPDGKEADPLLSKAAEDLSHCVLSLCQPTASSSDAAYWSAGHAVEKLLKAVIQSRNSGVPYSHDLPDLAAQVHVITGRLPPLGPLAMFRKNSEGGAFKATDLRYKPPAVSANTALESFIHALRLCSFLYPVLAVTCPRNQYELWTSMPDEVVRAQDLDLLAVHQYPGMQSDEFWQPPLKGLYWGDPVRLLS